MGHQISKNRITPEDEKKLIDNFRAPTTKNELPSFLGLTNYESRFIPHYS